MYWKKFMSNYNCETFQYIDMRLDRTMKGYKFFKITLNETIYLALLH